MVKNVFFEMYQDLPRQGHGSTKRTKAAFGYLADLSNELRILDVGCGVGCGVSAQTMVLADVSDGNITAVEYILA